MFCLNVCKTINKLSYVCYVAFLGVLMVSAKENQI